MTTISEFKSKLRQGGARSNQFTVELAFPAGVNSGDAASTASFLCNAASLPASTLENIPLQYRGRPVNFAGERSFAPWTITIINDGDFLIRNALENWSNMIANFGSTAGAVSPGDYQTDLKVHQLDRNGSKLKSYQFFDAFPIDVGQIALSYETPNIETFDITFQYNFYAPLSSSGSNAYVNVGIPGIGEIGVNL